MISECGADKMLLRKKKRGSIYADLANSDGLSTNASTILAYRGKPKQWTAENENEFDVEDSPYNRLV